VVCSGLIACGHDYALKLKSPLPLIQHIKLIDLRVDTLHVAADLDFLLADFSTEVWDGLGGVLRAECI
jgi:hypothetical protein